MERKLYNSLQVNATLVANDFIDQHMTGANGEYVKVYLYLLRHETEPVTISMIADALENTEADVKRALAYWEKLGIISSEKQMLTENKKETIKSEHVFSPGRDPKELKKQELEKEKADTGSHSFDMRGLADDQDFSQLLYIAQKYLNKVFTPKDCEVFGYLYGNLHMPVELLEYLVEYCAQSGHTSIRYIETVALNWYEKKLLTVEEAKTYSQSFTKDIFAVMKAFGLTGRKPGKTESDMIDKWFKTYGFTKEIIVEACNRTLSATHNPSFQYADKILSEWKKLGVKSMTDIGILDKKRKDQSKNKPAKSSNRFHNFEQNSYDYDEMVWSMMKEQ